MVFEKSLKKTNLLNSMPRIRKRPISMSSEILHFVHRTLDLLMELTYSDIGSFYYFKPNNELVSHLDKDANPELKEFAMHCMQNNKNLMYVPDADSIKFLYPNNLMCVRIKSGSRFVGCICLAKSKKNSSFFKSDFSLLKSISESISDQIEGITRLNNKTLSINFSKSLPPLLKKVKLEQKINDARYRLDSVLEVSNLINSSNKLDDMIESILLSSRKVMRAQSASMFLVEKETGDLLFSIVSNKKEKELTGFRVPKGEGIVGLCAKDKKTIVVDDAQNDERVFKDAGDTVQYITRNLIAAPLLVNQECIGVIEVLNRIGKSRFSKNDAEIFESFADSVALAVQRRILTDELTESNKKLERRLRETQTLHAVTATMIHESTADQMFQRVITEITNNLEIKIITVLIFDAESNAFRIAATSNNEFKNKKNQINFENDSVAKSVFLSNEAVMIKDISSDPELKSLANFDRYDSASCILIPLSTDKSNTPIGILCATEPDDATFQDQDFVLLKTIAVQLLRGYQNIQMKDAVLAKKAIEKELEITSRIQQNILPKKFKDHRHLSLHAFSIMAKTTGGDFYDYFVHKENGPASLLVADVSGKSLPAALFMAVSSSILRTFIRMELEPTETLGRANDLLSEESESGMFVTVFLSYYDPATGILKYASAGHNEMIIMHSDGSYELLSGKGHPLGILPTYLQKYKGGEIEIKKDDVLLLFTDGIIEAEDPDYNEYGMDRFIDILQKNKDKKVDVLVKEVYSSVEKFSNQKDLSDDFTMMAVKFPEIDTELKQYTFTHPVGRNSIPELRDRIKDICIHHGLYGEILDDILLVSDEAATNIVTHAFPDYNKTQTETFECDLQIKSRNNICLLFKDKGRPFDLEKVASPDISQNLAGKRDGGFGVFLIKSLSNKLRYERKNDTNYLYIEKNLAPIKN